MSALQRSFVVACFALASSLTAQDRVQVQRLEGTQLTGILVGVSAEGGLQVRTESGTEELLPGNLVSVTFNEGDVLPPPGTVQFDLVNGDQLLGVIEQGNYDQVTASTFAAGNVTLLLDHLREVRYRDLMRPTLLFPKERSNQDELFLIAGSGLDRNPGELLRLERTGVLFSDASGGERLFTFLGDKVVAVRLAAMDPPKAPMGILCVARMRDGSRLTGVLRGGREGSLVLWLVIGPKVTLDRRAIQSLTFKNEAFVFLGDLAPVEVEETPYLEGGPRYGVLRNRGIGPSDLLRIGNESFRRGIALNARTAAKYELDGAFVSLTAEVGVSGATRDRAVPGSARLRILADGQVRYESPLLVAGEQPRRVDIDKLQSVKQLTIIADFGESFQTGANVILANAMLLRAE